MSVVIHHPSYNLSVKVEDKTASAGKKPVKKSAAAKPKGEKKPSHHPSYNLSVKVEDKTASAGKKPVKKSAAAKPKGEKKPKVTAAKKTPKKVFRVKPSEANASAVQLYRVIQQ
ncbi:histone H1.3-like [Macrosteles quadrilineatus]|uniref:histone H1.3-like n=1 Tax=Macrosteles quadrilineatus TaxID=74068 RepID=UPI0023E0C25D|nr:histone H1.3-like [Macrosteles quadrilineatus]